MSRCRFHMRSGDICCCRKRSSGALSAAEDMASICFSASWVERVTAQTEFKGLDLLFLEVNRLEDTVAFYHDQLGFEIEKVDYESDPPLATLRAGHLRVTVAEQLETMLRRGRGVSFFIGVDDVDRYHDELTDRGISATPPADEGWGGRFITVEDPDKYRLFFVTWAAGEMMNAAEKS